MQCRMEIKRMLRNRYFVFWSLAMPIAFYYIFTNVVNTNAPDPAAWNAHYLMSMTTFSVMGSSITRHPHGSRTHPRLVDVHTRNASSRPHLFYRSNVGAKRHSYSFDHSNLLSRRLDQRRFFIPIGMVPVRIVGPAWLAPVSGDRDIDRDDEKSGYSSRNQQCAVYGARRMRRDVDAA